MRILHVVTLIDDQSSYGGPLTVAVNQCTELRRHGHDARILAGWIGTGRPPAELEGVPAHLFPVRNLTPGMRFSGLFSPAIAAWLRRHARSIDIAHVHLARDLVPLVASQILRRTGVPYVTQTHGMVAPDPRPQARMADRLLTLRALRAASARFVLTPQEQNALAGLIGAAHRTELLPNGVTIPRRGSVEETPLDVLFMARLHPRKRVIDFAHAAAKLIEEGHDAIFSVVGPDDGDLQELLRFIDARSFISGRLRYEGALPHDRALERLSKASIYVLPSVDEPFPMTLLEALALGKPSICTNSCGIAADLQADGAALISDPGPNGLARHLRSLIDSAERRAELGDLAVKVAQGRFSMESVVAELLVRYEKAVVGAGTRRPLLWVTNIPTPYRAALWKELARREPLVVAPLAETEPNRHWQVDLDRPSYDFAPLRARPLARLGETTIYLPSRRLLKLIGRRPRAVVLDGWESPAYLAAAFWARLRGVPVLASYRSTLASHRFSRGVVPFVRNWFFRRADAVITAGPASTEAVMAMGVPGDRITEGFNTVDVKRYARGAAEARAGVLRRPGHHFLYVGQLIPRKNVAGLIRAFATIANPDDTLAIVGTGPLEGELRELAQSLSLFNAIRFEGHLDGDELIAAYATADTFVLPSTEEVWGLVVNEALAAGLHAVVSRNAGIVPSILGMPGVFPSKPDQESLSINLKVSRDRWVGHLIDPPILANTPGQLAKVILGALEQRIGISC
jgi:glycosyltransferase involved in cell wall biosynthesis